jgi:hypothetical protein
MSLDDEDDEYPKMTEEEFNDNVDSFLQDWENMSDNEQDEFVEEGKEIMRNLDPDEVREDHAGEDWVDEIADCIEDYQNSPSPGFYPAEPSESGHYPDGDSGWDDDPELQ